MLAYVICVWVSVWVRVCLRVCTCMFVYVCVSEMQIDWCVNRLVVSVSHSYPASIQAREDFVPISYSSSSLQAPSLLHHPLPDTSPSPSSHPTLLSNRSSSFRLLSDPLRAPAVTSYRRAHSLSVPALLSFRPIRPIPVSTPYWIFVPSRFPSNRAADHLHYFSHWCYLFYSLISDRITAFNLSYSIVWLPTVYDIFGKKGPRWHSKSKMAAYRILEFFNWQ